MITDEKIIQFLEGCINTLKRATSGNVTHQVNNAIGILQPTIRMIKRRIEAESDKPELNKEYRVVWRRRDDTRQRSKKFVRKRWAEAYLDLVNDKPQEFFRLCGLYPRTNIWEEHKAPKLLYSHIEVREVHKWDKTG